MAKNTFKEFVVGHKKEIALGCYYTLSAAWIACGICKCASYHMKVGKMRNGAKLYVPLYGKEVQKLFGEDQIMFMKDGRPFRVTGGQFFGDYVKD